MSRRWLVTALWVLAGTVAALQYLAALTRPSHDRLADLHVYLGALLTLREGGSLYDFAAPSGAPFTYPPFAGVAFLPVSYVREDVLRLLWTAGTVMVIVLIALLATRAALASRGTSDGDATRAIALPAVALLLFASTPISSNIRLGQVSMFLAALILLDCLKVVPERYRGIATGVAGAIKLTPLLFVLYLWVSGQRRASVVAVATFVTCTALGWAVLPRDSVRYWFTELWNLDRIVNIAIGGNQSVNAAAVRLDIADPARTMLIASVGIIVITIALYRARDAHRRGLDLAAVVIVGCASVVASPVSWTHHQVWLVLAGLLAISERRAVSWVWTLLVAAVMILPVGALASGAIGGVLAGNARLWLAVAIAGVVRFRPAGERSTPLTPHR